MIQEMAPENMRGNLDLDNTHLFQRPSILVGMTGGQGLRPAEELERLLQHGLMGRLTINMHTYSGIVGQNKRPFFRGRLCSAQGKGSSCESVLSHLMYSDTENHTSARVTKTQYLVACYQGVI